jgi:epoxyqueuosine reductase
MDSNWIKSIALEEGVSLVGIADISDVDDRPYPEMKRALVVAVRLSDAIFDEVKGGLIPTHAYFHQYRTTNAFIDQALYRVGLKIQARGYRVVQVAASQSISKNGNGYQALFSHRAAAIRAGLGWIGKSNALVTKEFGPRVRLGTLMIEASIEADQPMWESSCGSCSVCVEACPAYALTGETFVKGISRELIVDVRACGEHMHAAYQHIGRGVVCGICIATCPMGNQRNR